VQAAAREVAAAARRGEQAPEVAKRLGEVAAELGRGQLSVLTRAQHAAQQGTPTADEAAAPSPPSEAVPAATSKAPVKTKETLGAPLQGDEDESPEELAANTGLTLKSNLWFQRPRAHLASPTLYVPGACTGLRQRLIEEHHAPPFAGHLGAERTVERLRRHFWWPGLVADVRRYCAACRSCAVNKFRRGPKRGVFVAPEVPYHRWEIVSMDFLTGIPTTTGGHDMLMVMVDRLTKRLVLAPTTKELTGDGAARLFVERVFREHGMPREILSDRDPRFTGVFWKRLHELLGTRLAMSTADHPQTDGQSEVSIRTVTEMLRHFCNGAGDDWDQHLWAVEFAYNDSVQAATGHTPFQADLGRDPATPCALLGRLVQERVTPGAPARHAADLRAADDFVQGMRKRLASVRAALLRAQREAELQEAAGPPGVQMEPGDYAFVRQDVRADDADALKLGPRWLGPFRVVERVGPNGYKLLLPQEWRIHTVLNVTKLRPAGQHRPPPATEATDRHAVVRQFVAETVAPATDRPGGERRLRMRLSSGGRSGRGTLLAETALRRAGFDELWRFAETAPALADRMGQRVRRMFVDPDLEGEAMKPFRGIVVARDLEPLQASEEFHVLYEDGDEEWLPEHKLSELVLAQPALKDADHKSAGGE
jgi:hypothetical protein